MNSTNAVQPEIVRVSVANLAWYMRNNATGVQVPIGILNPKKLMKGEKSYQALGGAVMLTDAGKHMCEGSLGATNLEYDNKTGCFDARFEIHADMLGIALSAFVRVMHDNGLERNPMLDIMNELSGKEFSEEYGTILPADLTKDVVGKFLGTVRQQLPTSADTSARARGDMPTHRLFRIFELSMPEAAFHKVLDSPVVRVLTREELATTNGGACAGHTKDGRAVIQNNLFLANV